MVDDWRARAACRDVDPELFFPVGATGPALVQTARAKAVCGGCPVCAQCLAFALDRLPEGIAGGLTPRERRPLRPAQSGGAVRGVNAGVVAALVAGEQVQRATRREIAAAAVQLRHDGHPVGRITAVLRVEDREVYRWLERYQAGDPLTQTAVGW